MVSINYAFKEIISKIVYYGPGLSGKTTNLQHVFKKVPKDTRGELISLATDADRTLYFDFLPVNVGNIRGFQVKFQLYTVPGQVYYNATRKLVLRGVDGLVFVADSQIDKMDENVESLRNLKENLAEYGYDLDEIPFVIQYNKRDLPNIASVDELQAQLNLRKVPHFEAVASEGNGVFATLKAISKLVIDKAQKSSVEKTETKSAGATSTDTHPAVPKPEPVSVSSETTTRPRASAEPQTENQPRNPVNSALEEPPPAPKSHPPVEQDHEIKTSESPGLYGELPEEVVNGNIGPGESAETAEAVEKPAIVKESETLTNVVVSSDDGGAKEEEAEAEDKRDNVEETTEHAVLKEESSHVDEEEEPIQPPRHHPDVLDADKIAFLTSRISKPRQRKPLDLSSNDSAANVADPKQMGPVFAKPQMAESVKKKGKKKAGLFGWLKKK